jgi:type IV pilus assembly protein PilC
MAKFNYKARDNQGRLVGGIADAANDRQVATILKDRGLTPVEIKPYRNVLSFDFLERLLGVSIRDKAAFTRQLATMMSAGLPLTEALMILQAQVSSKKLQDILQESIAQVTAGAALSTAFAKHPDVFAPLYLAMLRAGEASGSMDKTLIRLAEQMEQERDFRGKIKGALLYPAIVSVAMIGIATIMLIFVVPKIADVYGQFGADLPLPTQVLIFLSKVVQATIYLFPFIIVGIYFGYRWFARTPYGNKLLSDLSYKLPVFGPLNKMVTFAIMIKTLGALIGAGIPILDALRITKGTVGTNVYGDALDRAAVQVEKGVRLSIPLQSEKVFPQIIGQMVNIGEETGQLDELLTKLASYFEEESSQRIKNLTTALEPVLIVIMGVGVAGLALTILLPLFNLVNVIK